ncbi:MAG: DUF1289 domain-containing protein [Proteobacteria bacterium]|nr:DUF1289 domain-containing protein [Pseudomonadota bacterium]
MQRGKIGSPCVGVCVIDARVNACYGCFRTPGEITVWPSASDNDKRAILVRLDERRVKAGMPAIHADAIAENG